jgi:predicted ester cyclase
MGDGRRAAPGDGECRRGCDAHAASARRLVDEVCNGGDLAVLDELLAPPAPLAGEEAPDASACRHLRELLVAFRAAVPDARWTIDEEIAAGDTVVVRLAVRGTFAGPLVGLAPPGRPATLTGVAIGRFAEGRLVRLWVQADLLGLLEQLRVSPPLDLARAVTLAQVQRVGAQLSGRAGPCAP